MDQLSGSGQVSALYEETVEVTPAMMAAGRRVRVESGLVDDLLEADSLVLAQIYRAMRRFDYSLPSAMSAR